MAVNPSCPSIVEYHEYGEPVRKSEHLRSLSGAYNHSTAIKGGAGTRKRDICSKTRNPRGGLSGGVNEERLCLMSRRYARSAVWWRRGELNPCPKIVSALCLHV